MSKTIALFELLERNEFDLGETLTNDGSELCKLLNMSEPSKLRKLQEKLNEIRELAEEANLFDPNQQMLEAPLSEALDLFRELL